MASDNTNVEYLKQIEKKREYFEQREDSTLFEYYPHDITRTGPEAFKQKRLFRSRKYRIFLWKN